VVFHLPYGENFIDLEVKGKRGRTFLPRDFAPLENFSEKLKQGLDSPTDCPPLSQLCKGKNEAVIIVDDNTRPPTGRMVLPHLLPYLERCGMKRFTILIAVGLHSAVPDEQIGGFFGELPACTRVLNHDPEGSLEEAAVIGGVSVKLNSLFMNAPLKIVIADVELHQIFGYGGGAKSIVPGISDKESLTHLHSLLTHPDSGPGIMEKNPVQKFLKEIYRKVGVDFAIEMVLNQKGEPLAVFAGSLERTFREAVMLVDDIYKVKVDKECDIMVVSLGGFPRDIDLYQTQKVINMTRRGLKKNGKMIIFSECRAGIGPNDFRVWLERGLKKEEVERRTKRRFSMGLHKMYLFLEGVQDKEVYLYSELPDETVRKAYLEPIGLEKARNILAGSENIGFVPYGTTTLLEKEP